MPPSPPAQSLFSGRWQAQLLRDYGMVLVLLLLGVLFSLLTVKEQFPVGAEGGKQVARLISQRFPAPARVVIVVRETSGDRNFAEAAAQQLAADGHQLLGTSRGSALDARQLLEKLIAESQPIDAIIANEVTARWTIYDRFPEIGSQKCLIPQPYRWPDFLKLSNLLGVANQTSIYAIIAIGMTLVIISAGIDLSVGSLVALAAVVTALIVRDWGGGTQAGLGMVCLAMAAGIGLCALAGGFNGWLITQFRMPPFITTLGMMMMANGLAFRLSGGQSIPQLPPIFFVLGSGVTLGIPNPVLLMLLLYALAHVVMSRTVFGRYVYAIGGNVQAARLSGLPVNRVLLAVYILSGGLAGLGGVMLASQLAAGDPKFGQMYELEVIAAVVVGGTSLMGGRGKIFGTLIGAFIIAVIRNGMNLTNVDPFNQKIVLGAVLTGAVLLDTWKRQTSH